VVPTEYIVGRCFCTSLVGVRSYQVLNSSWWSLVVLVRAANSNHRPVAWFLMVAAEIRVKSWSECAVHFVWL
jgi:hypothetical protein